MAEPGFTRTTPVAALTPRRAYDIDTLDQSVHEDGCRGHGWCFGLPPGISPEQWPLNPNNGYPLMHGFTVLLPEDYRCHGPDIVALSFFSVAPDHSELHAICTAMEQKSPSAGPDSLGFEGGARTEHPRLFRLTDLAWPDDPYAIILLTQAEFEGPFCRPPRTYCNPYQKQSFRVPEPAWLSKGAAWAYSRANPYSSLGRLTEAEGDLAFNRSIRWTPRARDPNVGKVPREYYGDSVPSADSYLQPFYWQDDIIDVEHYRVHDWAKDHKPDHIGGTMYPAKGIPDGFGSYYIEFDEAFGGYNFGRGIAQLDFQNMCFDWAC
ncbi:hypothetical protein D3C76_279410 [compost metagenome]